MRVWEVGVGKRCSRWGSRKPDHSRQKVQHVQRPHAQGAGGKRAAGPELEKQSPEGSLEPDPRIFC